MEILSNLDEMAYLTTSQIQKLHHLGGIRNARRILNDMKDYLQCFQLEENVYYLSAKGRKEIGSTKVRSKNLQVQHHVIRNEVFIEYKPDDWKSEFPIKWADKTIIPDAFFRVNKLYLFLEVDFTQSMADNAQKINLYRELKDTGLFQKKYGSFPTLLFVTTTEYRQKKLRDMLEGMQSEILIINDLK